MTTPPHSNKSGPAHMDDPTLDPPIDGKCNEPRPSAPGRRCKQPAGYKTPHLGAGACWIHRGLTPSGLAAGEKQAVAAEIALVAGRWEVEPEWDARGRLAWLLGYARAMVRWLEGKVAAIEDEALVWGKSSVTKDDGGEHPGTKTVSVAAKNVWLLWLNEERDREHRLAVDCAKLGIEERRVQVQEDALGRMVEALQHALEVGIAAGSVDAGRADLFDQIRVLGAPVVETNGRPL